MKSSRQSAGLTLIEVLVALAIIAIAMTAIIKAAAQHIRSTAYLQDKTIAYWVANNVVAEARLGLIQLPEAPDKLAKTSMMLGQDWFWRADIAPTANERIQKIMVDVYHEKVEDDDDVSSLISLTGYLYREKSE